MEVAAWASILVTVIGGVVSVCFMLFRLSSNVRRSNHQNDEILRMVLEMNKEFTTQIGTMNKEFTSKISSITAEFATVIKRSDDRHVQIMHLLEAERGEHKEISEVLAVINDRMQRT